MRQYGVLCLVGILFLLSGCGGGDGSSLPPAGDTDALEQDSEASDISTTDGDAASSDTPTGDGDAVSGDDDSAAPPRHRFGDGAANLR